MFKQNFLSDTKQTRVSEEEESALMSALHKNVQDMSARLKKLEGHGPVAPTGRVPKDLENRVQVAATKQLAEFAKVMDKKLPELLTREAHEHDIREIRHRLRNIQSPDMAPVGKRVDILERKINEIVAMTKAMYNRLPVVVE